MPCGTRAREGGSRGCGSGGVGGRGTGPRDGANFATCIVFEGCPVRWGLGGLQGLRCRRVGGRGTGPRDGANFATCVVFWTFLTRTKRRKMIFFEGQGPGVQGLGRGGPGALVPGG